MINKDIRERLYHGIVDHFNLRVLCWVMSVHIFCYGLVIHNYSRAFEVPGREPLYANLTRYADAQTWGIACMCVGAFRFASLCVNGTFPKFKLSPHFRAIAAFLCALFWLQIVLGALTSSAYMVSLEIYSIYLWLDAISFYNATVEINPHGKPYSG